MEHKLKPTKKGNRNKTIQICPPNPPSELLDPLRQFACDWTASLLRPHPTTEVITHWDCLIQEWAEDATLPLFIRKKESEPEQLKCSFSKHSLNTYGWKLGHITGVGLNDRRSIMEQPIETLKSHFKRLMSPANMFFVPLELEGLAEVPAVIEEIQKYDRQGMQEKKGEYDGNFSPSTLLWIPLFV